MAPEQRRAERRRLLLDAAFDLLGEGGDAITVRAVCERARLNPRYFYESFTDRNHLLVGLYDDVASALAVEVAAALQQSDDLASATRAGIDTVFRFVVADPRRAQILYTEGIDLEPLAHRRQATTDALVDSLVGPVEAGAAAGITRAPVVEPIDIIAASMFTGGVSAILMSWLAGRIPCTLDEVIDDAVVLALGVFHAR